MSDYGGSADKGDGSGLGISLSRWAGPHCGFPDGQVSPKFYTGPTHSSTHKFSTGLDTILSLGPLAPQTERPPLLNL